MLIQSILRFEPFCIVIDGRLWSQHDQERAQPSSPECWRVSRCAATSRDTPGGRFHVNPVHFYFVGTIPDVINRLNYPLVSPGKTSNISVWALAGLPLSGNVSERRFRYVLRASGLLLLLEPFQGHRRPIWSHLETWKGGRIVAPALPTQPLSANSSCHPLLR